MSEHGSHDAAPKPNPRGGRPKLPPHMRRTERLHCVFTLDEMATLHSSASAAGLSVSDFVRGRVLKPAQSASAQSLDKAAALSALNRTVLSIPRLQDKLAPLSNNMNQIAKYLHTGRDTVHWLEEERAALEELRDGLDALLSRADSALKDAGGW